MTLWLPKSPRNHFFKFKTEDGSWKTFQIRRKRQLRRLMKLLRVTDAYYSVCEYLDGIEAEKPRDNLKGKFLNGRLCLDFDDVNLYEVYRTNYYMAYNHPEFALEYCLETKESHWQLIYSIPRKCYYPINNSWRYGFDKYVEGIYDDLTGKGFKIDAKLRERHSARVVRLPLATRKLKNGKIFRTRFHIIPQCWNLGSDFPDASKLVVLKGIVPSSTTPLFTSLRKSLGKMKGKFLRRKTGMASHLPKASIPQYYRKYISSKILSKSILSLRNHLWFSPQLIQV